METTVIWHDIRRNPEDIPFTPKEADEYTVVLGNDGNMWFYDDRNEWNRLDIEEPEDNFSVVKPDARYQFPLKAWCYIPKFKG